MSANHPFTRFWQSKAVRQGRHLASPRLWYRYLSAPRRMLPTFIIAGAQKAGTTSLFGYLAGHPQCLRPLTKEVNYFDQNFARGERWYRMHFPVGGPDARQVRAPRSANCFEASPHYMFRPQVAARVRQTRPEMKTIFLLRDPASRAYSHYQHEVRRGRTSVPFEECVELEIQQAAGDRAATADQPERSAQPEQRLSYLARGVYVDQLLNWRSHFPAEQMLVLEAERMFRQPGEVFREVLAFLELDPWTPPAFANLNPGRYRRSMPEAARARANEYFAPHNERLFQFLGQRYQWN